MQTKLSIFCSKIIEAGWLVVVAAVPLFFNIYTARTFEPDKITLLRSVVSIMVLAWIVMVIERGFGDSGDTSISWSQRIRNWFKFPLFLPTLLLVIIYIVSTVFSISPQVSLWGSYQRMQGTYSALSYIVVFALIAGNLRTRPQVDRLVTIIIISSVPVGLYGIIQRYGLDPLPWAGDVTSRVASNMGNAIFVASYLIMIVPLALSRLIESMVAIIKEETTSWGHTILAALYIFVIAIQIIAVLFSGSRGPMLGLLGASFVMGLLIILILRQMDADQLGLTVKEIGFGILFVIPLGVMGALAGGIGFGLGWALEGALTALNYQATNLTLLGAALGGLLGFLGLYTYMAASGKGWRWLWLSWFTLGALAIMFVVALNLRGVGLDNYLDPVRRLPYLDRLANVIETEGTGKVRVLIWDAAMELIVPHAPLGIENDGFANRDNFNVLRPLIGYGPESMFNAFAYVYPPGLAHVEARGSSADRSHNETMDSLVITGILGFLAFYFLMVNLFYYVLKWLGWVGSKFAKYGLLILLTASGIIGAIIPYLAEGKFTFTPIGLPFGLITGMVLFVVWRGIVQLIPVSIQSKETAVYNTELNTIEESNLSQTEEAPLPQDTENIQTGPWFFRDHLLFIGVLGAIVGHFIEVHFVFSIAATYTYFWVYAGLLVALYKIRQLEAVAVQQPESPQAAIQAAEPSSESEEVTTKRAKKRRARRTSPKRRTVAGARVGSSPKYESWETWLGGQGLAMAIILVILTFDFITPQFEFTFSSEKSTALFWMLSVTWLVGFGMALSNLAVKRLQWQSLIGWPRAVVLYVITSLSYFFFYILAHRLQFGQRITVQSLDDVIRAANVLANGLIVFYLFLLLLMVIFAIMLSWRQFKGLPFWRSENWWLYPPLALAILTVIWFKNIDVVRADTYLKEGERYRNSRQWNEAIALHEKARSIDSDEDFYYLMLALDYQLMAQDGNLDQAQRQYAWQQGEQIALQAREINPYNPDNTGNMGRYYFTLGQVFNPERFQDALGFFEKATVLAPSNVIYHNLWAQTFYILQDYQNAVDRLQTSVAVDPEYSPTWILLGDTYAAMGNIDKALEAHTEAQNLYLGGSEDGFRGFSDQFFDQRLNFYISAGRGEDIIGVMQQAALDRPEDPHIQWAIGHAYNLVGQPENTITYLEQARTLEEIQALEQGHQPGGVWNNSVKELSNIYLAQNAFDQALPLYEALLQQNPADVESHSALGFIYARLGNLPKAIEHNLAVVQQLPEDYDSLKNLALLYRDNGQIQEALDAARRAQAVAPEAEAANWPALITEIENQLNGNN